MKNFFGVVAVGAMFANWLIMATFVFAEFGGWGILALGMTPLITGTLGPPVMWLAYGVPEIALWVWGAMIGAWVLWMVTPKESHPAALPHSTPSRSPLSERVSQADVESRTLAAASRLARIVGDTDDKREIMRLLESELVRNAQDAEVWHALSQSYGETGEIRRAYEAARTALRIDPSEGRYHFTVSALLAWACAEARHPGVTDTGVTLEALEEDFDVAKSKAEHHARESIRLGVMREFEQQARENLMALSSLASGDSKLDKEDVQPQPPPMSLDTILADSLDTQETIERLRAALRGDNQNPQIWFALSQCHADRGDQRRSYDTAQVATGLNPSVGRYHLAAATVLVSACVESMIEEDSDTGRTLQELGLDLARAISKAEFHLKEAIRLSATMAMKDLAKQSLRELKNAEKQYRRRRK